MKLIFTILCTLFISLSITAQKKTVAITSFENSTKIPDTYIKSIEDKVKEAFYSTNRFDIVDRTNYDKLQAEKELQKSEDFIDGKTVDQTSLEGAEQIVTGSVSQIDILKHTTETRIYYDCKITFSLQVIDIATGQILASELIRPKESFFGSVVSTTTGASSTPEKAFHNALKGTQKAINQFVGDHFPVTTLIIEISEASSDKAKILLLNTGNLQGAKKNQEFTVVELVSLEVGGKTITRKKELGKIKITKVEGEEISVAKVTKGGAAIYAKFNAGAKIECYSKN
jgi:hypothetical protein